MSFKSSGKQKIFSWGSIFELESQKTFPIISNSQPLIRPLHIRKVFISERVVVASKCYLSRTAFIGLKIWQLVVLDFWNVNIITLLIKIHLLFSIHWTKSQLFQSVFKVILKVHLKFYHCTSVQTNGLHNWNEEQSEKKIIFTSFTLIFPHFVSMYGFRQLLPKLLRYFFLSNQNIHVLVGI